MDGKMLARIGAVVFVGVAITAAAIEMTRQPEPAELRPPPVRERSDTDRVRQQLRQCRDMGEAATRDPACLKLWSENRDRFLKQRASAQEAPAAPTTLFPSAPAPADDPIRKESAPADMPAVQPEPARPEAH